MDFKQLLKSLALATTETAVANLLDRFNQSKERKPPKVVKRKTKKIPPTR